MLHLVWKHVVAIDILYHYSYIATYMNFMNPPTYNDESKSNNIYSQVAGICSWYDAAMSIMHISMYINEGSRC